MIFGLLLFGQCKKPYSEYSTSNESGDAHIDSIGPSG